MKANQGAICKKIVYAKEMFLELNTKDRERSDEIS